MLVEEELFDHARFAQSLIADRVRIRFADFSGHLWQSNEADQESQGPWQAAYWLHEGGSKALERTLRL